MDVGMHRFQSSGGASGIQGTDGQLWKPAFTGFSWTSATNPEFHWQLPTSERRSCTPRCSGQTHGKERDDETRFPAFRNAGARNVARRGPDLDQHFATDFAGSTEAGRAV